MDANTKINLEYVTRNFVDGKSVSGYRVTDSGLNHMMRKIGMVETRRSYDFVSDSVIERHGVDGLALDDIWEYENAFRATHQPPEEMICDCGHWEYNHLVMNTSHGTSCVECYDRMSD